MAGGHMTDASAGRSMDHTISHQPDTTGLKIAVANTIRAFSADDEPANLA